jgi:hypothetical protein
MNRNLIAVAVMAAGIGLGLGLGLAPIASAVSPYENCSEAAADGVYNIPEGSDNYWPDGDRDDDGIACESSG